MRPPFPLGSDSGSGPGVRVSICLDLACSRRPCEVSIGLCASPRSPNHSHAHCPLCCRVFTGCLKNSLLFFSPLYIKSEPPLPSKTCAAHTHSENISPCVSELQVLSKNKIVDVSDMRSSAKLIPGWFSEEAKNPRHSAPLLRCRGPSGDKVLPSPLHVLSSQLPPLHVCDFGRVCNFWSSSFREPCPENTHPAKLGPSSSSSSTTTSTTTSQHAAHRSTYALVRGAAGAADNK